MHFNIRSCDVSALAGRNVFRSRRMAIRRLIEAKLQHKRVIEDSCSNSVLNTVVGEIRSGQCYQEAVKCRRLTSDMCVKAENECRQILERSYPHCNVKDMYKRYKQLFLKDRGVFIEAEVVELLKQQGKNVKSTNKKDRSFSKTFTTASGLHTYTLYGCVDAICSDENAIFEIKSRKSEKMTFVHEMDQIVIYLVLSGLPVAYIVEYVDDRISISPKVTYNQALKVWVEDIKANLETAIADAACRIVNSLP